MKRLLLILLPLGVFGQNGYPPWVPPEAIIVERAHIKDLVAWDSAFGAKVNTTAMAAYSTTAQANGLYNPILGFTPYNSTNPNGYISGVSFGAITGQPSDNANMVTALNTRLAVAGNGSQLTGLTKTQVGLSAADNTSDASKPVSSPTQTALDLKQTIPVAGQGIGGTVTQLINKSTAVTLNKTSGQITMVNSALAAAAEVAFTLTNSTITSTDVVIVNIRSVGTVGAYFVTVGAVANGSCSITVGNASTGSLSQAVVLNFCVIKAVSN